MTALDVRAEPDLRTLVGRIEYLIGQAGIVAGSNRGDGQFAAAVSVHLERVLRAAEIQAAENEMLRAQAADRERARAVLTERLPRELDAIERAAGTSNSAAWAIRRMRRVLEVAVQSAARVENPKESRS